MSFSSIWLVVHWLWLFCYSECIHLFAVQETHTELPSNETGSLPDSVWNKGKNRFVKCHVQNLKYFNCIKVLICVTIVSRGSFCQIWSKFWKMVALVGIGKEECELKTNSCKQQSKSNTDITVRWVVTLLRELACHMGSWDHTVLPATQQMWHSRIYLSKAGTRFSDPGRMQGSVDPVG